MIPKKLREKTIKQMMTHAEQEYPNEACGVVIIKEKDQWYQPCRNVAKDPSKQFQISPIDFTDAEDLGEVVGVFHSHPDGTSVPSSHDLAVMSINRSVEVELDPESKPTPWHIIGWPNGDYRQVIPQVHQSLLDRQFIHGVWDCWQTCAEYYKRYHDINFPRFEREDCWWEDPNADSLYESNFESAGFYKVNDLLPGDMIVMQIGRSYHPNHAAIYLGNGITEFEGQKFHGGPFILHHLYGRKSEISVFGGMWEQRSRMILRHREVKHA